MQENSEWNPSKIPTTDLTEDVTGQCCILALPSAQSIFSFFSQGLILKKYIAPQTPSQFLFPENPPCNTSQPHWILDIVKARFQSTNQIKSRPTHSCLSWHIQLKPVSISIYYLALCWYIWLPRFNFLGFIPKHILQVVCFYKLTNLNLTNISK